MTVRKVTRGNQTRWVIDIPYKTIDGRLKRYRRDAQVQMKAAAESEHRRLIALLGATGTLDVEVKPADEKPASYTFGEAVAHYRRLRAPRLKPSTRHGYDALLDRDLLPRFGGLALCEINGPAISEFNAELANEKLRPATQRNYILVLRSVLRFAVESGLLDAMPKLPALPKVGRIVIQPLTAEDVEATLAKLPAGSRLAVALGAYAGLREGEVRALVWANVDLKSGRIFVRQAMSADQVDTPKSHHQRTVPIAGPLLPLLTAAADKKRSPWENVALTSQGKPWTGQGLNRAFKRALAKAGREGWHFHSLRHFFVTSLCRMKAPTHVVQKLVGHASLSTTERYLHAVPGDLDEAIALFGKR